MDLTGIHFKWADAENVEEITQIIAETSGGLIEYILADIFPGVEPHQLLMSQVLDTTSCFSYHNSLLCCDGNNEVIGLLHAYPAQEHEISAMVASVLPQNRLDSLQKLTSHHDDNSFFINTLWIAPEYRGSGLADALLDCAIKSAQTQELSSLCLHVWNNNTQARKFYAKHSFYETDHFSLSQSDLLHFGSDKLQLSKRLTAITP